MLLSLDEFFRFHAYSMLAVCLGKWWVFDVTIANVKSTAFQAIDFLICCSALVIDRIFGSAKLFGRTFTLWFGPNDRTFFCRTQNFFSYYIQCQWQPFIFLFCLMTHMFVALSLPTKPKLEKKYWINLKLCLFVTSRLQT